MEKAWNQQHGDRAALGKFREPLERRRHPGPRRGPQGAESVKKAAPATPKRPELPSGLRSELGGQVAVDFEPDAEFDKGWRCPGHWSSSS